MRASVGLILCLGLSSLLSVRTLAVDKAAKITGTWEGESKCVLANSPCNDEHVLYDIRVNTNDADHYTMDAYKIVAGQRDFMGTLDCHYPLGPHVLRCIGRRPDDVWTFTVTRDHMTGTLTIGTEKQLYRNIAVQRVQAH
jgi:hypothetical protein